MNIQNTRPEVANDKELTVTIQTTQGTWISTFLKTTKVQEVIQATINHFQFSQQGNYQLRLDQGTTSLALSPERPLVSYGIKDGDVLIFTDLGVAV